MPLTAQDEALLHILKVRAAVLGRTKLASDVRQQDQGALPLLEGRQPGSMSAPGA